MKRQTIGISDVWHMTDLYLWGGVVSDLFYNFIITSFLININFKDRIGSQIHKNNLK